MATAAEVAAAFDRSGADWAVLHGAENYPACVGRDLDILVPRAGLEELGSEVEEAFRRSGWRTSRIRRPWSVHQIIASSPAAAAMIGFQVDLLAYQTWRGIPLVAGPPDERSCERREGLRYDPWGGFVKRILIQSLAGNWEKLAARKEEWSLGEWEAAAVQVGLCRLAGEAVASGFLAALESRDATRLRREAERLGACILRRAARRPLSWFREGVRYGRDKVAEQLLWRWRAPVVALRHENGAREAAMDCARRVQELMRERLVFPSVRVVEAEVLDMRARHRLRRDSAACALSLLVHPKEKELVRGKHVIALDVAGETGEALSEAGSGRSKPLELAAAADWLCERVMGKHHELIAAAEGRR